VARLRARAPKPIRLVSVTGREIRGNYSCEEFTSPDCPSLRARFHQGSYGQFWQVWLDGVMKDGLPRNFYTVNQAYKFYTSKEKRNARRKSRARRKTKSK
jgi:hypothetical protein